MKKNLCFVLVFFISILSIHAQYEEKMSKENVVKGTILKNGGKTEGYIKMTGIIHDGKRWGSAPWEFQGEIKFIPKDVFEKNEKIKNSFFEKYTPKDCDGYLYDTLVYESVKYQDLTAVGMNMLPKKVFMHRVVEGKVCLFDYFDTPSPVLAGDIPAIYEGYRKVMTIYRVGVEGKLKSINNLNIEKELADCPIVVEKNAKGEYKIVGSDENSSGFTKLLGSVIGRENMKVIALLDYNKNCGK